LLRTVPEIKPSTAKSERTILLAVKVSKKPEEEETIPPLRDLEKAVFLLIFFDAFTPMSLLFVKLLK
jgi:hypothetical protein